MQESRIPESPREILRHGAIIGLDAAVISLEGIGIENHNVALIIGAIVVGIPLGIATGREIIAHRNNGSG